MTNEGAAYLNGLRIAWRILGPNGVELDRVFSTLAEPCSW